MTPCPSPLSKEKIFKYTGFPRYLRWLRSRIIWNQRIAKPCITRADCTNNLPVDFMSSYISNFLAYFSSTPNTHNTRRWTWKNFWELLLAKFDEKQKLLSSKLLTHSIFGILLVKKMLYPTLKYHMNYIFLHKILVANTVFVHFITSSFLTF